MAALHVTLLEKADKVPQRLAGVDFRMNDGSQKNIECRNTHDFPDCVCVIEGSGWSGIQHCSQGGGGQDTNSGGNNVKVKQKNLAGKFTRTEIFTDCQRLLLLRRGLKLHQHPAAVQGRQTQTFEKIQRFRFRSADKSGDHVAADAVFNQALLVRRVTGVQS